MIELKSKATILFQGDSITDGGRSRDDDKNHVMGHSYPFHVAGELGLKYAKKEYNFLNRGISGDRVVDLYQRWQLDAITFEPDLISILVGVNDVGSVVRDKSRIKLNDRYEKVYRALLDETLEALPDVKLVIAEPFILPCEGLCEERAALIKIFNEKIKAKQEISARLAQDYKAIFVPLQNRFNEAAKSAPPHYFVHDGVHPTWVGHKLIADAWIEEVSKHIKL